MKTICSFTRAWVGSCEAKVPAAGDRCPEHAGLTCDSCRAPATRNCGETMGPLCCGANLCDGCEHTTFPNGCNGGCHIPDGMSGHCRKSEQKFVPWYVEGSKEKNAAALRAMGIDDFEAWERGKQEAWERYLRETFVSER